MRARAGLPKEVTRQVPGWRRKYKHLYYTELSGDLYVFRPLTWHEFRELGEIQQNESSSFIKVVDTALLWPEILPEDVLAGVPHHLFQLIMEVSGFGDQKAFDEGLDWARKEVQGSVDYTVISMICKAFPYKPEDLEEKPFLELMTLLAMAEGVLDAKLTIQKPKPSQRRGRRLSQRERRLQERLQEAVPARAGGEAYEVPLQQEEVAPLLMSKEEIMNPRLAPPDFERENQELGRIR